MTPLNLSARHRRTIPALHLSLAPHRAAYALTVGRYRDDVLHGGAGSPLRLRELPAPDRPPGWVRIAPRLAGICASDRKMLSLTGMGRTLLGLYGLNPRGVVLGHEVVGTVVEADADAGLAPGDRVVAEPTLACAHKGLPRCARCASGRDHQCAHFADAGDLATGPGFGFDARYGGGWAGELVAPADRVHRVPDALTDQDAVLAEPMAIAAHAVLQAPPAPGRRVLVIGPGTIGLSVIHSLRVLTSDLHITAAGVDPHSDVWASDAGADALLHGRGHRLVIAAGGQLGTTVRGGRVSGPILEDGFDVVYDAVASSETIDASLRMLRPGGMLMLLGTATDQTMDWSLVWHRELVVRGSVYYAVETVPAGGRLPDGRRRGMRVALEILEEVRPGAMVTHVFPLEEAVAALGTAARGPGAQAVKVAFAPSA